MPEWSFTAKPGALLPAIYTRSPYPLQYYLIVSKPEGKNIYPGFNPNLTGLPYFVVRSIKAEQGRGALSWRRPPIA